MKNLKLFIFANYIILSIASCAWQKNPTPSTMDNSLYSQEASNIILHSVSNSLESKIIFQGINEDLYVIVYALYIDNKPVAVSVVSTPNNYSYFVNLIKSENISETLFAPKTKIIHSETVISKVRYNSINNEAVKTYLNSLGFNENNDFLRRTTYFYHNNETLTLVDYIFPNKDTNQFDM